MLNHFVIVRYRYPLNDPLLPIRRRYLEEICFHGLKSQTNNNFKLVVLSDEKIDCDLQTTSGRGLKRILPKEGYIITTRVDSDDVVLPDFIDVIQKNFHNQHRLIIDHSGYNYDVRINRMTEHTPPVSHPSQFLSLIEKADDAVYCMYLAHPQMHKLCPVKVLPYKTRIFCVNSNSKFSSSQKPGMFNNGQSVDTKPYQYYINKLQELDKELRNATLRNNKI